MHQVRKNTQWDSKARNHIDNLGFKIKFKSGSKLKVLEFFFFYLKQRSV